MPPDRVYGRSLIRPRLASLRQLIDYDQFCGIRPAAQAAAAAALPPEQEVTVEDLKKAQDRRERLFVLDVREPQEFQICRIPGSTLIPLGELPNRIGELPSGPDAPPIVVHCKMGGRSAKAVKLLRDRGFKEARNLAGGILAWIDRVDPTLPKY